MADNAKWYVVHTYSGYENTVAASIEKAVENRGLRDLIQEVSIPLETVTEITDNGPKTVERKVFPGYVLVKMVMTDDTWHLVRNIRGATGFVGSGNKAIPLTDEEIAALGVEKREVVVGYQVGDNVKITDGALESFLGRGGDRPGSQQGTGGGLHVRPRNPRRAGAGSGRAGRMTSRALRPDSPHVGGTALQFRFQPHLS